MEQAVSKRQGVTKVKAVMLDALAANKVAAEMSDPTETGNAEGRKARGNLIKLSNVKNPSLSVTLEVDIRVRRRPLHPVMFTLQHCVIRIGRHQRLYSFLCVNLRSSPKAQC